MLAIELEPKSMEPATAPEAQHATKQYCFQLKKSVHISVMFMTLPRFSWDYKDLFKTGCLALFTIHPLKNIKITIYTYCYDYDVCYMQSQACGLKMAT